MDNKGSIMNYYKKINEKVVFFFAGITAN